MVFGLNGLPMGGMERQFIELVKRLDRNVFAITLITLFQFPGKTELYDQLPADITVHKLSFSGVRDIRNWWRLYRLVKHLRSDVLVSSLFFANTAFRLIKPLVGYTCIAREHNTYRDKPLLHRLIDRVLSWWTYRIVAVSTTVADFTAIQEGISRKKFLVIHNGIDTAEMRAQLLALPEKAVLREEFNIPHDAYVLLNIARLAPQKNHELLIDGFALFHKDHPEAVLVIVGEGDLRPVLEEQARAKGVSSAVRFFGLRRDVERFYKVADCFISTSHIEGLSNAYLEALAAGLPLIATKTGGTDELLEHGKNGYSISNPSSLEVAEAMRQVYAMDCDILKEQAHMSAESFSMDSTMKKYTTLLVGAVSTH